MSAHPTHHHARRAAIHRQTPAGHVAEGVAAFVGTWRFVAGVLAGTALWLLWNGLAPARLQFDAYPYSLNNWAFGVVSMILGSVLLMGQIRQGRQDRTRDTIEAEEVHELHTMNRQQLEILALLKAAHLARATAGAHDTGDHARPLTEEREPDERGTHNASTADHP